MTGTSLVSIVAMLGWLVLATFAFREHRVGARKTVAWALTWAAIFALVIAIFAALGRQGDTAAFALHLT